MTDRLAELVVGLQRLAENAVTRGDDLRYVQLEEIRDHVAWLDHQLAMIDKVRMTFLEQRRKFVPERERERVHQLQDEKMPRVVTQPLKESTGK